MSYNRVLITGAGGMLGGDVYRTFLEEFNSVLATDIDTNEEWIDYLDVRDWAACEKLCASYNPDLILHLAALTDLEYCENEKDDAWSTNALGTQYMTDLALQHGATIAYISTAGIFDGKQESYTEEDQPIPINQYGKSKYFGEKYVVEHVANHFVFRAGWMMGGGIKKDKKFIKKIYTLIAEGKKELYIVDDKAGTPTYTVDFAKGMLNVIQSQQYGLYNQVCSGDCTRYDVALKIIEVLGLSNELTINKVSSDYFSKQYFAERPASEILLNERLNILGLNLMRDWQPCLEEYLLEFKEDLYARKLP